MNKEEIRHHLTKAQDHIDIALLKLNENGEPAPAPAPPNGPLFWMDSGHGGHDPGAVNTEAGLEEKSMVLDVQQNLLSILPDDVFWGASRLDDSFVELSRRAEMANDAGADWFVSLHINDADDWTASGFEVWIAPISFLKNAMSFDLAMLILNRLKQAFPHMPDRGLKEGDFTVLTRTSMPAVLVEFGFIHGDRATLEHPDWALRAAACIRDAWLEVISR